MDVSSKEAGKNRHSPFAAMRLGSVQWRQTLRAVAGFTAQRHSFAACLSSTIWQWIL
jgi:hypothetical protein